jgi:hypothetical protein
MGWLDSAGQRLANGMHVCLDGTSSSLPARMVRNVACLLLPDGALLLIYDDGGA